DFRKFWFALHNLQHVLPGKILSIDTSGVNCTQKFQVLRGIERPAVLTVVVIPFYGKEFEALGVLVKKRCDVLALVSLARVRPSRLKSGETHHLGIQPSRV